MKRSVKSRTLTCFFVVLIVIQNDLHHYGAAAGDDGDVIYRDVGSTDGLVLASYFELYI